jgi:hypothetical protein
LDDSAGINHQPLTKFTSCQRIVQTSPRRCDLFGDFRTIASLREWRFRATEGANEEDAICRGSDGRDPRAADERSVPEVAKKHRVSAQTIYAWRKHFGSLEPRA